MVTFKNFYNKHFIVKEYEIKEKHIGKFYITPAIKSSIRERNRLQRLYAKWPLTYERTIVIY